MKTRGLSRFFPTLLMSMMMGGKGAPLSESGSEVHYHSHGSFHRRGKLKGWMRENRKSTFNKNK
jgi:hypothetical protein